jgi:hypothetical protein
MKLPLCAGSGGGSDHLGSLYAAFPCIFCKRQGCVQRPQVVWPFSGPCAKRELHALGLPFFFLRLTKTARVQISHFTQFICNISCVHSHLQLTSLTPFENWQCQFPQLSWRWLYFVCSVIHTNFSWPISFCWEYTFLSFAPAVQHRPKWLIFYDMPTGMGCSQGVDLDIISHLDMLADMLWKV